MNKSILLLTDEMNPGGVARHVVDLANGLVERGFQPIVAATDGPFRARLDEQIAFVNLPILARDGTHKSLIGFLASYRILNEVVRREKVTIIHSHKRYTDLLGRIVARRMSLSHISTCHNIFSSLKHVSFFGDTTIACSKVVQEMLIRDFGKKMQDVIQIYYGILPFREFNKKEKNQVFKALSISAGTKIIASVGQLIESKDRVTLVRAIGILRKRGEIDNVLFAILGDGEQKTMLEELVRNEAVHDHVMFLQGTSNVEALFNVADFMVLSSIREGLPYVILEAASIGKPHIATNVGGVSEFVIHGETGVLVPPNDPEKLADAIKDLLDNPEKVDLLGTSAREKFLQQFTYDKFIDRTGEVYKDYFTGHSHAS